MFVFNNKVKRILSLFLLLVMFISALPIRVSAINTDQITLSMNVLKASSYPDGWFWCGGDPYKSLSYSGCGSKYLCLCNNFNYAYQCHGFALVMAQRTVGSFPAIRLSDYRHGATSNGWTCYTSSTIGKASLCAMGLRPGDIVRASTRSDYSDGHTAIVWKVEGGRVYFAECWGHVYSKIKWGAFNAAYTSMEGICSGYTYVALLRNKSVELGTGACPHSYKEGYESAHPHRRYTACSYCQDVKYTGEYVTVDNCVCCNGTHSYVSAYEDIHPHKETKTCNMCGYFTYSGKTTVKSDCPVCLGIPYDAKASFAKDVYSVGESITLDFFARNAVKYKVVVRKDSFRSGEFDDVTGTSVSFTAGEVGRYIATVTAYASDGKSVTVESEPITVKAPITKVVTEDGHYYMTYSVALSYENALAFCEARALTLTEHTETTFVASFKADSDKLGNEYVLENLYTYIPAPLSYYEAVDFSACTGGVLASSDTPEIESTLVKLCVEADSDGIILGADDDANEGMWITAEGNQQNYFNWNISYSGGKDRYKNYLFMFPGGTVTDGYAMPGSYHGFVVKTYSPFTYTDNGDGTLTLYSVAAIESSNLEIPAYHEGKPVVAIHSDAFARGEYGEVFIPSTVTRIDAGVFAYAHIKGLCVYRDSEIHKLLVEYQVDGELPIRFRLPFSDVKEGAWYYKGVDYCYQNSYISGTSSTTFSPNVNLTREQFVLMLANVAGADLSAYTDAETGMTDVPSGQWYSAAVAWAVSEGYVSGVAEGVFGRGQNITREQLARLFYLYSEKNGMDMTCNADLSVYADEAGISEWAYENVRWAVSVGLISGMTPTTLGARGTATRAQAARIFMLFDEIK